MRIRWPVLGTALGLLNLTARLAAQTLPAPALPTPHPAEVDEAPARRGPWDYAVGAGIGWDGNIDFLVPNGPSGVAVVPHAGLARVFRGPHSELRATAAGRWTGHPGQEDLDRYNADFSLDGSYRRSPATRWRASASYRFGDSDSSRILVEQGVSLPVVKMRSLAAALGLSRRVSARTSLRIDGRIYRTAFDSPVLIDGESARGTVGLERQLDARSTAAAEYSMEHVGSEQRGSSYLTHFGSLQWTRVLSLRSAFLLEGGASYTPDAGRAGLERKESFFGGASFTRQVKRSSLRLFLRREVTPAFGSGASRVGLRAGMGAVIPMGRAWEVRIDASHVRPGTTEAADPSSASSDAFAALGRRVGRRLEVSGEARYRRRGAFSTLPVIEAFRAGLFLTLLTPSGRAIGPAPGF